MEQSQIIWEKILSKLKEEIRPVLFSTWFLDAEPLYLSEDKLTIYVPSEIKKTTIEMRYGEQITNLLKELTGAENPEFEIICAEDEKKIFLSSLKSNSSISESYTFSNFIVGSSNRFAQAAALAVATKPSESYNPLFIYGPSGLGKTHLLYAIANEIRRNNHNFSIIYIKGDEFANDLISSIQNGTIEPFRLKYRKADLLLVDDIQFIAGKERTQEEFFHTFNSLHETNKQIVLTSDRPPREIHTLEDRLKTRFEWGLLADIQPPDYETRVAIISKKAENLNISLPPEVMDYIASSIKNNVRQLEGVVKKICALKELMKEEISTRLAERAIKDIMSEGSGLVPSTDLILEEVANVYNVSISKLLGNNRTKELVVPRQIAMYLIRSMTGLSLPDIGKKFNRDHSTVLHSINKIEQQVLSDSILSGQIKDLIKNIEGK